ncbi:MAG: ATP-binding protein [Myxococcota bacterium]
MRALLGSLGTRLGVDRTTVYSTTPNRRGFRVVATWSDDGVPRVPEAELPSGRSQLVERTLRGQQTRLERIETRDESAPEDVRLIRSFHQKSLLVLPLRVAGSTVGAHVFDGIRSHFAWPRSFIADLELLEHTLAMNLRRLHDRERLERERSEHEHTQRIAGIGHWRRDSATRSMHCSAELVRAFQLDPRAELDEDQLVSRVHGDDRDDFQAHVDALLTGSSLDPIECRVVHRDLRMRWYRCWGEVTVDRQGAPSVAHGVVHDITDRKLANDALERTNRRLVQAQEDERARLGRELHDDLGQRVAALTLRLDHIRARAAEASPPFDEAVEEALEQLSEVGLIVRDLSHTLHPADLRRLGLASSLASLSRRCSMLAEIDVEFEGEPEEPLDELEPQAELALFRVVQESLSNALRHAKATHIKVGVGSSGRRTWVSVTDDGMGFSLEELDRDGGLGLLGMKERMRLVGGTVEILTERGEGTQIVAGVTQQRAEQPA